MNRSISAMKNLISNLILQVVSAVFGFIIPAMLIRQYGSEVNGIVASIKQFIAYLSLVEAGIGAATIVSLYKPLAEKNYQSMNKILSETRAFYFKSGYIFSLLILLLATLYPLSVIGEISKWKIAILVITLSVNTLIDFFFFGKYRTLLIADQKTYVFNFAYIVGTIIYTISAMLLIRAKVDIIIVQIASNIAYMIRFIIIYIFVKKSYPYLKFVNSKKSNFITQKWSALVHQISGLVVNNSPIVLATILTGFNEVSVLSIYVMILNAVVTLVNSFSNSLTSGFGQLYALKERNRVRVNFSVYECGYLTIQTIICTCTSVLILPFIAIYTAGITDANYNRPLLAAFVIVIITINVSRIPYLTIVNAAGHYDQTKYKAIAEAIINILGATIFGIIFGLEGVLLGSVISYVYRLIDFIIYANNKVLLQTKRKSIIRILRYYLAQVFLTMGLTPIANNIGVSNYLGWIALASGIFTIITILLLAINLIFDKDDTIKLINKIFHTLRVRRIKN